jgi:hypothetical protein
MEVKPKIKIVRASCRCSGCQENGHIWTLNEDLDWCCTISVVGNHDVWAKVVQAMREYGDVLFDDSGIEEVPNEE